jgi:phosphate acetyltransferase
VTNPLEKLRQSARGTGALIVLAEGEDARAVAAAERAQAEGLCRVELVGAREAIAQAAAEAGVALTVAVLEPATDPLRPQIEAWLADRLRARQKEAAAAALALDPLPFAAARVALGAADGAVMGARATTADTIRAALVAVGPRPGLKTVSSCFLMV